MSDTATAATLRIDKLLWFLRLAPTRSAAQALAETGFIRANGRRVEKAHHIVRPGDRLTLPPAGYAGGQVRVVEILHIPDRRGPASAAQACYRRIDALPGDD